MISMVVVYLVVVVLSVKERLLQEDHAGQHAAQTPHVQTVVVHLETEDQRGKFSSRWIQKLMMCGHSYLIVHQQLGAFEIAGGHSDVVFLSGMVKFSQTPVYKTQLLDRERKWK